MSAGGGVGDMKFDIPSLRVGTGTAAITMFAGFFLRSLPRALLQ